MTCGIVAEGRAGACAKGGVATARADGIGARCCRAGAHGGIVRAHGAVAVAARGVRAIAKVRIAPALVRAGIERARGWHGAGYRRGGGLQAAGVGAHVRLLGAGRVLRGCAGVFGGRVVRGCAHEGVGRGARGGEGPRRAGTGERERNRQRKG